MANKIALLVFDKCHPEQCDKGSCAAAKACKHKLIKQESRNELPMLHPSTCQGCGDCARACPLKAIMIARM